MLTILSDAMIPVSGGKPIKGYKVQCSNCDMVFDVRKAVEYNSRSKKLEKCRHCVHDRHNMSAHPMYAIWGRLKFNSRSRKTVLECGYNMTPHWDDFNNFKDDMFSTYSEGMAISRVDTNKPYQKDNCIWITGVSHKINKVSRFLNSDTLPLVIQASELNLTKTEASRVSTLRSTGLSFAEAVYHVRGIAE